MLLYQILECTTHRKVEKEKKDTKTINLKYPCLTWNQKLELPDGSYSVSDITFRIKT